MQKKQQPEEGKVIGTEPILTIIHFNDVYDIQPRKDGQWGIVNFEAIIRQIKKQYPNALILFSGDCFSPSALTNIFQGQQMVYCLNKLGIDVACYGNHQFDLQSQVTLKLAKQCNFPWLLGNIKYRGSNFLLGDGQPYLIKTINQNLKIGIFGIAGEDWLGILGDQYEDELEYIDCAKHSERMCQILKKQHNCNMIIALTHMRVPLDRQLPQKAPEIDLVLGGHDHIVMQQFINNILVVKSGDNFKKIRTINIYQKNKKQQPQYKGNNYDFDTKIITVPKTTDPNPEIQQYVQKCMGQYTKHDRVIGWCDVDMQTRFSKIRTQETNYGNFITDLVRSFYDVEVCVLNSGGVRIDSVIKPGALRYSTISNIINDILVVKLVPGKNLLQALEYACSSCPEVYAGSFLQVSGLKYSYDYRKNPRVQEVIVGGQPLDLEKQYKLATHLYISNGGDGFEMFKHCQFHIDPLASIDMLSLLLKFFKAADMVNDSVANNAIVDIQQQSQQIMQLNTQKSEQLLDKKIDQPLPELKLTRKASAKMVRITKLRNRVIRTEENKKLVSIAPIVEDRIKSLYP